MRVNYVIIFVSDMSASISFYRDVVGLPLRFESPAWTEFATEGATWALHHEVEGSGPGEARADQSPADRSQGKAGNCRPGFSVADLDEFHRRMVDRGVPCLQPPKDVFGARVAQYQDPDGLGFGVSEERGGG